MSTKTLFRTSLGVAFFLAQNLAWAQIQKGEEKKKDSIRHQKIEEIVLVGYKKQNKETLTSSVSSVSSEKLKDVTNPDFQSMLQGKMAGVSVALTGGQPGKEADVRIRGVSSLSADQSPLYVVDGVIVHGNGNVPPEQIADVTVLKDAAATALYGSRGSSGVIVITTKGGKGNSLNVDVRNTFKFFNRGNLRLMNSQEQKERFLELAANGADIFKFLSSTAGRPITSLDQITDDFDWMKAAQQVGVANDVNLSFSRSSDGSKTFITGGYYKETGTIKGYDYNRFSFRLNNDTQLKDWIKVSPKLYFTYEQVFNQEYPIGESLWKMPWDNPFYPDGTPKNVQDDSNIIWYSRGRDNYFVDQLKKYGKSSTLNGQGNLDFEIKVSPHLKFISSNSLTYYNANSLNYNDPTSISGRARGGTLSETNATRWTKYTNQMLRYENNWNDKHQVNALLAYEYMDYMYKNAQAGVMQIISGSEVLSNGGAALFRPNGQKNEYAFRSVLSNAEYSYAEKYLVQASLRMDESSRFTSSHRRGWFWAFSAGWNVSNEGFMESLKESISKLKLRASYGLLGNAPSNYYGTYNLSEATKYNGEVGVFPNQKGNSSLKWENIYQANFGVDFSLFKRINFTFDYYNKETKDLISEVPRPYETGFSSMLDNIGTLRNRGIELSMDADIIRNTDFSWNVGFNISKNKATFINLYKNNEVDGIYLRSQGDGLFTYYLREWAGVNAQTGAPQWYKVDDNGEKSIVNNINEATLQHFKDKSRLPDFTGGFSTSLRYKGISLSTQIYFSVGGYVYNNLRYYADSDGTYPTYNQMALQKDWIRWSPNNTPEQNAKATHPSLILNDSRGGNQTSTRYLEKASFLKIRNISLAYDVPKDDIPKNTFKSLRVSVSLENFFRFTSYSGPDPEVGFTKGGDYNHYPLPRSISIGLNLTF